MINIILSNMATIQNIFCDNYYFKLLAHGISFYIRVKLVNENFNFKLLVNGIDVTFNLPSQTRITLYIVMEINNQL